MKILKKTDIDKPRREASKEINSADTVVPDLQPPEI